MGAGYVCAEHGLGMSSCVRGCDTNADCDQGIAAYDADNYECNSGGCEYRGCNSNEECESVGTGYICLDGFFWCVPDCDTSADCDLGSAAYDADNYECTSGGCMYSGCNSNEECESSATGHICR
jgi:hypothetical protein